MVNSTTHRQKNRMVVLFIGTATGIMMIINQFPPAFNSAYPKCLFKSMTSFDCPGCGNARALYDIGRGNWLQALDANVLLFILLPVIISGICSHWNMRILQLWKFFNRPMLFFILIVAFWIIRNIDTYPFNVLHSDK